MADVLSSNPSIAKVQGDMFIADRTAFAQEKAAGLQANATKFQSGSMATMAGLGMVAMAGASVLNTQMATSAQVQIANLQAGVMRQQSDNQLMAWNIQSQNHLDQTRILADQRRFEVEQMTAAQKFQTLAWMMTENKRLNVEQRVALKDLDVRLREIRSQERQGLAELDVRRQEILLGCDKTNHGGNGKETECPLA